MTSETKTEKQQIWTLHCTWQRLWNRKEEKEKYGKGFFFSVLFFNLPGFFYFDFVPVCYISCCYHAYRSGFWTEALHSSCFTSNYQHKNVTKTTQLTKAWSQPHMYNALRSWWAPSGSFWWIMAPFRHRNKLAPVIPSIGTHCQNFKESQNCDIQDHCAISQSALELGTEKSLCSPTTNFTQVKSHPPSLRAFLHHTLEQGPCAKEGERLCHTPTSQKILGEWGVTSAHLDIKGK